MKISNECVVSIHYTLTDDDGEELDSSRSSDPLSYLHGAGGLINGLERALEGRKAGDSFRVAIQPADAYGEMDASLVQEVPLDALAEIPNLTVGMKLQSESQSGQVQILTIDTIGSDTATLNANHELAGRVLHFDVAVETVREATAEEIEHGHAH